VKKAIINYASHHSHAGKLVLVLKIHLIILLLISFLVKNKHVYYRNQHNNNESKQAFMCI